MLWNASQRLLANRGSRDLGTAELHQYSGELTTERIQAVRRPLPFDDHIGEALLAMEEDILYIVA